MRKLLAGFLIVCSFAAFSTFTSCKKDSEGTTQEKLVGKWTVETAYFDYHFLGISQKDTITGASGSFIQINADGTTSASDESEVIAGTWKLQDNKLQITENGADTLTVDYDIVKLTSNELQLHNKEIEGENYVEVTMHLKK